MKPPAESLEQPSLPGIADGVPSWKRPDGKVKADDRADRSEVVDS
jgi:hypothetical protein